MAISPDSRIERAAVEWNLDADFLKAVVTVESAWNEYSMRFEPHYIYMYNSYTSSPIRIIGNVPPNNFRGPGYTSAPTELVAQKTSWGPMQVMGAVAREYGFKRWLSELCSWDIGVQFGCKHLHTLKSRFRLHDDELHKLATAYNTGSPKGEDHPYWKKIKENM